MINLYYLRSTELDIVFYVDQLILTSVSNQSKIFILLIFITKYIVVALLVTISISCLIMNYPKCKEKCFLSCLKNLKNNFFRDLHLNSGKSRACVFQFFFREARFDFFWNRWKKKLLKYFNRTKKYWMQIKNEGFIELKHWTKRRRNRQRHRKTHYKLNDISTTT